MEGTFLVNKDASHSYNLDELGNDSVVEQDLWHALKRLDDDKVLLKSDVEYKLARRDLGFIYKGVGQPAKPIILNGKRTALSYYFGMFEDRFDSDYEQLDFELSLSFVIDAMCCYRRAYHRGSILRNEQLRRLTNMDKFAECCDVIREILIWVHSFFWASLFAKWAFRARQVQNTDNWTEDYRVMEIPVYNIRMDYELGNKRMVTITKDFVSTDLIETILGILRWSTTNVVNYGYQTFEYYCAHKRSFFSFWRSPHYQSFEDRANNDSISFAVISDEAKAQNRIKLCTSERRMRFEFNNTLKKTLVDGTKGLEFFHSVTNFGMIWKSQRNMLTALAQNKSQMMLYNKNHYDYVFINCWYTFWPKDIKARLQKLYTDFSVIYQKLKNLKRNPRNPCVTIKPNYDFAKQWVDDYVKTLDLPMIREPWNIRKQENDSLLMQILLTNVKAKRIKMNFTPNNKRTKLSNCNFRYTQESESENETDCDEECEFEDASIEDLTDAERLEQHESNAKYILLGDKRMTKWRLKENPALKKIQALNKKLYNKQKVCTVDDEDESKLQLILYKLTAPDRLI